MYNVSLINKSLLIITVVFNVILVSYVECFRVPKVINSIYPKAPSLLRASEEDLLIQANELTNPDASFITIKTPQQDMHLNVRDDGELTGDVLTSNQFGSIFAQSAPYIAQHRGSIMVIHLPSKLFHKHNRELFDKIMDDISILHLLGIQLVLVAGVREQLEDRLKAIGHSSIVSDGMRVSDDQTMDILKDLSGSVRIEVESSLGRGFRGAGSGRGINIISGNSFYSAKPVGVRNGIDFKHTGEVRKIENDNFKRRLDGGDVVLLTSLGHSHSGEVFNVPAEMLAAECASKLGASKVIFLTDGQYMFDNRNMQIIQSLRHTQAAALIESLGFASCINSPVEVASPRLSFQIFNEATGTTDYCLGSLTTDTCPKFIVLIARFDRNIFDT